MKDEPGASCSSSKNEIIEKQKTYMSQPKRAPNGQRGNNLRKKSYHKYITKYVINI
jgi:hypothetical protein